MSEATMVWFLVVALSGQGRAVEIHPVPFNTEAECQTAVEAIQFESRCFPQSVEDVKRGFAAQSGVRFFSERP